MNRTLKSLFEFLSITFLVLYLAIFAISGLFYLSSMALGILRPEDLPALQSVFWWTVVGVSLSMLASLCAWPFALSLATLIEQNRNRPSIKKVQQMTHFVATLPLVVFGWVYIEIVGYNLFDLLEDFWISSFASINPFTQALAFALTTLFYPLTVVPVFGDGLTVDLFYQKMLQAVIDFAEVGLVTSVVVLGLAFYIIPRMVMMILSFLESGENHRSMEVIQSLGGTQWESIHMTVMQAMKVRFNFIILSFTRLCFLEGLLTFLLLNFYFLSREGSPFHWGSTLSTLFMENSLKKGALPSLMYLAGFMLVCFFTFKWLEAKSSRKFESANG